MNEYAALSRLIENLIRLGIVAEVDHGSLENNRPPRLRVQSGELLTGWLPWITFRAGTDAEWDPPTRGEQVVLFSPSGLTEQGIALTGLFSQQYSANADRAGLHRRSYSDGAVVEYDSQSHTLMATLPDGGKVRLTAPGGVSILGDVDISGLVTVSNDVIAAGISLIKHKHPGDSGGTTGAPIK
jgi:phage baseplate assembly protein V